MRRRSIVIGGIAVASALLIGVIGYMTIPNMLGPQAPGRHEVVKMVERVHGDVSLVREESVEESVGILDMSEYTFEDSDGLEFLVMVGVADDEGEDVVVHDMWGDAYMDAEEAREKVEGAGGSISKSEETGDRFVDVPKDASKADGLKSAMDNDVPKVPEDMAGYYHMLCGWTFRDIGEDGSMWTWDLFGYLGR